MEEKIDLLTQQLSLTSTNLKCSQQSLIEAQGKHASLSDQLSAVQLVLSRALANVQKSASQLLQAKAANVELVEAIHQLQASKDNAKQHSVTLPDMATAAAGSPNPCLCDWHYDKGSDRLGHGKRNH